MLLASLADGIMNLKGMMMIREIEGWGDVNSDITKGSVLNADSMVYLLVKHGYCTDANDYRWEFHHNINEEFYIACYDLGIEHSFLGMDDFISGIYKFIEGEL